MPAGAKAGKNNEVIVTGQSSAPARLMQLKQSGPGRKGGEKADGAS